MIIVRLWLDMVPLVIKERGRETVSRNIDTNLTPETTIQLIAASLAPEGVAEAGRQTCEFVDGSIHVIRMDHW